MRITIPANISHLFDDDPVLRSHAQSGQPFEVTEPICVALLQAERHVSEGDKAALEAFLYPIRDELLPTYAPVFTGMSGSPNALQDICTAYLQVGGSIPPREGSCLIGCETTPPPVRPPLEHPRQSQ